MASSSLEHKAEILVEAKAQKRPEINQERDRLLYEELIAFREFNPEFPPGKFCFINFVEAIIPILAARKKQFVATIADPGTRGKAVLQLYEDKDKWTKICNAYEKVVKEDSWDDLLDLDIVINAPDNSQKGSLSLSEEDLSMTGSTIQSWSYPYQGRAHLLLWDHMNNHTGIVGFGRYTNVLRIAQSSGMGKSRVVDELGKEHFLIPLCLREGKGGYPPPDVPVRKFLTSQTDVTPGMYRTRCYALFIGLFDHTYEKLIHEYEKQDGAGYTDIAAWFHSEMSPDDRNTRPARVEFYQSVIEKAKTEMVPKTRSSPYESMAKDLITSVGKLADFLRSRKRAQNKMSKYGIDIIVAFDEAHVLDKIGGVGDDGYKGSVKWTALTILHDVFRTIRNKSAWGLFISTTGKLSQSSPIDSSNPSSRIHIETLLPLPPFSDLTFDIFAHHVEWVKGGTLELCSEHDANSLGSKTGSRTTKRKREQKVVLDLKTVTDTKFMVRFGRPMFPLRYMEGNTEARDDIVRFAMQKLLNKDLRIGVAGKELELSSEMTFACLSQRLCLEFDSTSYIQGTEELASILQQEKQIEDHMRVCIRSVKDNEYIISTSGSEPILAEAAATIMMADTFKPAESLKKILEEFVIVDGKRGEPIALLAMTVARDEAVRNNILTSTEISKSLSDSMMNGRLPVGNEEDMKMFRAVTVVDFMSSLFMLDEEWEKELKKDFIIPGPSKRYAFLHFNHLIKPYDQSTCNSRYILLYMVRGAAVNCTNWSCGSAVDFLLPALFGTNMTVRWLTYILVQVQNDVTLKREKNADYLFGCMDVMLAELFGDDSPHPVIRIIFSLGSVPELSYTKRSFTRCDKTYIAHDFWCGGMDSHLRPTKKDGPESWKALAKTTMGWEEVYKDSDGEDNPIRMSLHPGGGEKPGFWSTWAQR